MKFLHKKQGEKHATPEQVSRLFAALHQMEIAYVADNLQNDLTRIDKNRFEAFLLSHDNDAFDPARERFDRRLMTRPISEYWINSSHNTYLTGVSDCFSFSVSGITETQSWFLVLASRTNSLLILPWTCTQMRFTGVADVSSWTYGMARKTQETLPQSLWCGMGTFCEFNSLY